MHCKYVAKLPFVRLMRYRKKCDFGKIETEWKEEAFPISNIHMNNTSSSAVTLILHTTKCIAGNILQAGSLMQGFLLLFFRTEMISTQQILKRLSRTSVQLRQYSSSSGNGVEDPPKPSTQKIVVDGQHLEV